MTAQVDPKAPGGGTLPRRVWRDLRETLSFLGRHWPLYVLSVILGIAANVAYGPGLGQVIRMLVNSIADGDSVMALRSTEYLALIGLAMGVLGGLAQFILNWVLDACGLRMREKVMSTALAVPVPYWDTHRPGDTVSLLSNDVETAKQGIGGLQGLVTDVGLIVSCVVTLLAWGPETALALLVLASLCLFAGARFAGPVRRVSEEYQEELARVTSAATGLFSGVAVVKSLQAEDTALARLGKAILKHYRVGLSRGRLLGVQDGVTSFSAGFASAGVMIVAGILVLTGRMTPGQAIGTLQLASLPLYTFTSLGSKWAGLQQSLAASRRVVGAAHLPVERDSRVPVAVPAPPAILPTGEIAIPEAEPAGEGSCSGRLEGPRRADPVLEFDSVTFGYNRGTTLLDRVRFRVGRRQKVAVVGTSGSGKTSILRLIQRFYEPWQGALRLYGRDTSLMPLKDLRGQVAFVSQEPFIFPSTVRENIAMGREDASDEDIAAAAKTANAHEFIARLPSGYETVLDERGGNLSVGQKQRICLARAFLKGADLLLLDEPTSSVDAESESLIAQSINEFASRGTVLLTSHTAPITEGADVVLTVADGKVKVTQAIPQDLEV